MRVPAITPELFAKCGCMIASPDPAPTCRGMRDGGLLPPLARRAPRRNCEWPLPLLRSTSPKCTTKRSARRRAPVRDFRGRTGVKDGCGSGRGTGRNYPPTALYPGVTLRSIAILVEWLKGAGSVMGIPRRIADAKRPTPPCSRQSLQCVLFPGIPPSQKVPRRPQSTNDQPFRLLTLGLLWRLITPACWVGEPRCDSCPPASRCRGRHQQPAIIPRPWRHDRGRRPPLSTL